MTAIKLNQLPANIPAPSDFVLINKAGINYKTTISDLRDNILTGVRTISDQNIQSSVSNVDFTSIGSHGFYRLEIIGAKFSADAHLQMLVSIAAAFKIDATYAYCRRFFQSNDRSHSPKAVNNREFTLMAAIEPATPIDLTLFFADPASTALYKYFNWKGASVSSSAGAPFKFDRGGGAYKGATSAIDGLRIRPSTGMIDAGHFILSAWD